jgi:hypothetical protein
MNKTPTDKLIDEVEDLCKTYVGKNAECEQWFETCKRFERLDKLVKKIRKEEAAT